MKGKSFVCALLAALILSWCGDALAARTTRDLVFEDEDDAPAKSAAAPALAGTQKVGLKTTVLLNRDGQTSTVAPSHVFKSGDKVKLVFTPNIDGYVYWMAKGSSGSYTLLYPRPGMDNSVRRNEEYTVPPKGAFRFDANAGQEELLCILSDQRLNDLEQAGAQQFAAALEQQNTAKRTTRDLVFEDEEEGDVSTKTQQVSAGTPFVERYTLQHN